MNLPASILQKLATEEDLNNVMAEAQVSVALMTGPIAATAEKGADGEVAEAATTEQSADWGAVEAAIEIIRH